LQCDDDTLSSGETDIDCGGLSCDPCGLDETCEKYRDCESRFCHPTLDQCVTRDYDADGDLYPDLIELKAGTDPTDATDFPAGCGTDAQCVDYGSTYFCDTTAHMCVECTSTGTECDTSYSGEGRTCSLGVCTVIVSDCTVDGCISGVCDSTLKTCVECTSTDVSLCDSAAEEICVSNVCTAPGSTCTVDCSLTSQVCDEASSTCVECTDADVSLCDSAAGETCVSNVCIPDTTDSDGDGLTDAEEATYGTDPTLTDTDADGLGDYDEVNDVQGYTSLDPLKPDTDDDGLTDGEEVGTYITNPTDADTDDDGLLDGEEITEYGTDPKTTDTDGDGSTDYNEVKVFFTDPLDEDSDDDGTLDGKEYMAITGP